MPRFLLAAAIVCAALLQAAVLPQITPLQVRPNLVLVLVLLWTVARGLREGAIWAFGAGIFLDLVTLGPLGGHALALMSVAAIGALSRLAGFRLGLLQPMLAALVATLAHDTLLLLIGGAGAGLASTLLRLSLLAGLFNLVTVPAVALLTDRLQRWVVREEEAFGRPRVRKT